MEFSFLHISDIHLGRPFSDITTGAEELSLCVQACKKSFNKIIDFAIEKKVDFVLIAGDSFDSDEHDLGAKLLFIKSLEKLADNGIKSYVICGNHDPIEMYKSFKNYFYFDEKYDGLINITGVTTEEMIASFSPVKGVNIHTVSFEKEEMKNPIKYLPKLSLSEEKEFNIGLIHCDLDKKDSKYAPVSRDDLRKLGYDYYALGHIHLPQDNDENMIYSGTIQARSRKEKNEHGCFYIEVNSGVNRGARSKKEIEKEFIPFDVVRFMDIEVDCSGTKNKIEVFEKISEVVNDMSFEVELNLLDITLVGTSNAYDELLKSDELLNEYRETFGDNKKVVVYNISNGLIPEIDENEIRQDKGIVGIISNVEEDVYDGVYENIARIHEKIYKSLGLDTVSKEYLSLALEEDKDKIIDDVKKELMVLCKEIYNSEE